jgi:hypothetical protein
MCTGTRARQSGTIDSHVSWTLAGRMAWYALKQVHVGTMQYMGDIYEEGAYEEARARQSGTIDSHA